MKKNTLNIKNMSNLAKTIFKSKVPNCSVIPEIPKNKKESTCKICLDGVKFSEKKEYGIYKIPVKLTEFYCGCSDLRIGNTTHFIAKP